MKKRLYTAFLALATAVSIMSCDRDPVAPPEPVIEYVTIAELREMHKSGAIDTIKENIYIQGVVTLTPEFKNIPSFVAYVQDSTGAICLTVSDATNTLTMDSEVKILCYGVIFEEYNGLLQFGSDNSLSIAENIEVITLTATLPEPETVTIAQLLTGDYQGMYVSVPGVQFEASGTFSGSKVLTDCTSEINVYTTSAATFSGTTMPAGNGVLKGISSIYNDQQILLRDPAELDMTGSRCGEPTVVYLTQDFQAIVKYANVSTIPGWLTYPETGTKTWFGNVVPGTGIWVQATSYQSGEASNITWMTTPPLDFTDATNPYITFDCANGKNTGATLTLLVSTDYTGSATPWTATWTELTFTRPALNATGWSSFVTSGQVDLTAYKGGTVYVAWKYTGSSTLTTTWEIDNVLVAEK